MTKNAPHDERAERATLGSVLIDPQALLEIDFLRPEHFFLQKHHWIFEVIKELEQERASIDFVTVLGRLEARNKLKGIGGDTYISKLLGEVPSAINIQTYAKTVYTLATRRQLLEAASAIARLAYDRDKDLADVMGESEYAVFGIRQDRADERMYSAMDLVRQVHESLERAEKQERTPVLTTGYPEIDQYLGGLYRQSLVLVAGRTGLGKTALMLNMAQILASLGKVVGFFSCEMSAEAIAQRFLVSYGHVSLRELRTGKIQDEHWPGFADSLGKFSEMPIYVDDTPRLRVGQLRAKLMRMKMAHGLDVAFVDYVQLMRADAKADSRYLEIGEITRGLKGLAKELDIPIVAGAQVGRAAEGRIPTLDDLRESGDQEQDADGVVFLFRERHASGPKQSAQAIIAKNRHGPTGTADLYWIPARASYVPVTVPESVHYGYMN